MRNLYEIAVVGDKYDSNNGLINTMVENATRLKDGWQLNHPGQEFDSNPERSDALNVRTAVALGALASSSV